MSKTSRSSRRRASGTPAPIGEKPSSPSTEQEPYAVLQTVRAQQNLGRLEGLEPSTHQAMLDKLRALKVVNPYAVGTLEKIEDGLYRVRQGNWRARIITKDEERVLLVEDVVRRNEATY